MEKKNKGPVKVNIIPDEIEECIMSRVPVKTIVRFMSVCKSWYSLFLDPSFIIKHQKNNPNNSNLHLVMCLHKSNEIVVADTSSVVHSHHVAHPRRDCIHYFERNIVGSCNGIVCVHGLHHCCIYDKVFSDYICLWNPALRVKKYIRVHDGPDGTSSRAFVGFGFDIESNDYKVVRFDKARDREKQVEIYSLSSDSWKTLKVASTHNMCRGLIWHIIRHHRRVSSGVYVNSAHHWALVYLIRHEGKLRDSTVIFSFDVREEVFKETVVPIECTKRYSNMMLFNYNESLAMLTFDESSDRCPYIWVMKDYWLPQSWNVLCKIDVSQSYAIRGFIQIKNEVILSKNANYYKARKRPIVFDIDKSKVNHNSSTANIEVLKDAIDVMSFSESLLLLGSKNLVHY